MDFWFERHKSCEVRWFFCIGPAESSVICRSEGGGRRISRWSHGSTVRATSLEKNGSTNSILYTLEHVQVGVFFWADWFFFSLDGLFGEDFMNFEYDEAQSLQSNMLGLDHALRAYALRFGRLESPPVKDKDDDDDDAETVAAIVRTIFETDDKIVLRRNIVGTDPRSFARLLASVTVTTTWRRAHPIIQRAANHDDAKFTMLADQFGTPSTVRTKAHLFRSTRAHHFVVAWSKDELKPIFKSAHNATILAQRIHDGQYRGLV